MLENQIFWLFLELVADDDVMLFERPAILKITGHLMVHVHDGGRGFRGWVMMMRWVGPK